MLVDDNQQHMITTRRRHIGCQRHWFLNRCDHCLIAEAKFTRQRSQDASSVARCNSMESYWVRFCVMALLFCHMISLCQSTTSCPKPKVALDENSVVLITGAAGFVGSALAIALHRVYHVPHLILIDSMGATASTSMTSYGSKLVSALSSHPANSTKRLYLRKTRHELALRELKRQRMFHVLQTLGSAATFYRADVRPTLPEYFDIGEIPTLDYIFTTSHSGQRPITHVVHLADAYHAHDDNDRNSFNMEPNNPQVTQAVPRIKEHPKAGMMETLLEQLYKVQQQQQQGASSNTSECPPMIPHFVYASSYEVYNHLPHRKSQSKNPPPFDEAKPITTPSSLRGASKLMDELLVRAYHTNYGIHAIGLRFFCIYGPWGQPASPLYELAQRAVTTRRTKTSSTTMENNDEPLLPDDYESHHVRDYVYIDDAVDAIMAAMQFQSTIPVVINVGTGVGSTMSEIVKIVHDYFPQGDASSRQDVDKKKEDVSSPPLIPSTISIASTQRAKQLLGFEAQVSLQEGIGKLLAWHYDRAHPNGNQKDAKTAGLATRGGDTKSQNQSNLLPGITTCAPFDQECFKGAPVFPCVSECSHPQQCQPSYWDAVSKVTQSLTAACETVLFTVELSDQLEQLASAHHAGASSVPGAACNVAFVSETSVLVRQLRRANRKWQQSWWSGNWLPSWPWSRTDLSSNVDSPILRHGIWTLVPVMPDSNHAELAWLPKLSPGFMFGPKTRRAIYCDSNVIFPNISKLLEEASKQPFSQDTQGATAMLIGKGSPQRSRRRPETKTSSGSSIKEAVQQAAYRMVHIAVHEEMAEEIPLLDSSFVVHTLQHEDSRQFRCDVYGEVVQWEVASDDRPALQLMLGLHDMWSRVLVQNGGNEPWWVGNSVEAVPEENSINQFRDTSRAWFSPRGRRRLQALTLFSEQDDVNDAGGRGEFQDKLERAKPDSDESREQAGTSRRLDNAEEVLPENEETEIDGKLDGVESLEVKDGFGDVVHRPGDPIDEASKGNVIDVQATEDENDKGEDDDVDKEKGNARAQGVGAQAQGKLADKISLPPPVPAASLDRDASSRDIWMGVLSSTSVHYFIRIVPPSVVGAAYLDVK